jgi:hypothetical protein
MDEKIKLNRLVESYAFGFGRIVEIAPGFWFTVKYYGEKYITYDVRTETIKFHED